MSTPRENEGDLPVAPEGLTSEDSGGQDDVVGTADAQADRAAAGDGPGPDASGRDQDPVPTGADDARADAEAAGA
jgi:hypothetical protein